jgi:hypothetical protein
MLSVVPLFEFTRKFQTNFIQTTARPLDFAISPSNLNKFVCFFLCSIQLTMPKTTKNTKESYTPYSRPRSASVVTPVNRKKLAPTKSHHPSASISRPKVVTGLNLAQKAEDLYVAADVNGLVADAIDHHLAALEEWKAEEGASSVVLLNLLRELRYCAVRLREAQRISRTCAAIVSPLKNSAGTHDLLKRGRKEEFARAERRQGRKKWESDHCALLKVFAFRLDSAPVSSVLVLHPFVCQCYYVYC